MSATAHELETAIQFLQSLFADVSIVNVGFQFWDGTRWPEDNHRAATLVLKHPDALQRMFGAGTEMGLAEAFLRDDFDVEGDIESAIEVAEVLSRRVRGHWLKMVSNYLQLRRLSAAAPAPLGHRRVNSDGVAHSRGRDRQVVSFHYDVSNDFFQLWLDSRMLYSCAYFHRADDTLEAAQTAKLHHLCRKLRLRPGDRLLDVGCGWGGLSLFAAQHYNVHVVGITLSAQQVKLATQRVTDARLTQQVLIEQRDYRDLNPAEPFDAIVSVGMSEHVGRNHLAPYFKKLASLVKPGGVVLNHAIGEGIQPRVSTGPSFIQEYVFPDSDIPPLPIVLSASESAGLEVRDVENLREHYMLTLRHWVKRLEAHHTEALAYVDEPTFRVWRLYMAASARGFERGNLAIYQVLLARPTEHGDARLPLTRLDWYTVPSGR